MWYINPINYDVDDFRRFKEMNSRAATLPRYPRLCWKVFFGIEADPGLIFNKFKF